MWFPTEAKAGWAEAESHLSGTDGRLRRVIEQVGPCTLAPRRDYFVVLCKAIFTQQISTAVAAVLFKRFQDLFPSRRPTPSRVLAALEADSEVLRRCGLSRQKQAYLKDLAEHFEGNLIPTRRLVAMDDEAVIEALVKVKGIGRWTAEMFLIFTLNRPDVLPVDDLGLRKGAELLFDLPTTPDAKRLTKLAEPWRPWRSVATWYIWRGSSLLAAEKRSKVTQLPRRRRRSSAPPTTARSAARPVR